MASNRSKRFGKGVGLRRAVGPSQIYLDNTATTMAQVASSYTHLSYASGLLG